MEEFFVDLKDFNENVLCCLCVIVYAFFMRITEYDRLQSTKLNSFSISVILFSLDLWR